jgi:hypothetical protein
MTRRLEAGPLLVTLGAVLLLVSLFLSWFSGDVTAWEAFEVWDVVLFVVALGSIAAGLGLTTGDATLVDRRLLPAAVTAVAVIVASQIIDPPPAAQGQEADTGAWLALGSALVMCAGAVLTFGRVHLALTVERRDARRHVAAVDARGPRDETTETNAIVVPDERPAGRRLFARERTPDDELEPDGARAASETAATKPVARKRVGGKRTAEEKQD